MHSNSYEVDPLLAGTSIELVYDPFDLDGEITVNNKQGILAGTAKPVDIGLHVHTKVINAVKDNDTATNINTGINYLDLVATRHRQSLSGAPISFADLHDHTTPKNQTQPAVSEEEQP